MIKMFHREYFKQFLRMETVVVVLLSARELAHGKCLQKQRMWRIDAARNLAAGVGCRGRTDASVIRPMK
jgi:hypothetical protein